MANDLANAFFFSRFGFVAWIFLERLYLSYTIPQFLFANAPVDSSEGPAFVQVAVAAL